ncbi:YafY family protein [uncultured Clostridium sp.]|uniref:helix-turn-helix transcriptional regulator n=1 Tax=uncultured Clostridium sp. TaxID=59620 RepID=UPI0025F0E0AF|nr:WYL domain-containing protein [uncultured Clostridium sp.]
MFPDFIKHYDIIRSILRDVFLYGCFSKSELENKNKNSSRKISYEMRRIRQYIKDDFVRVDRNGKNKLLNLSCDSISNTKNFLVRTYLSKSFTRSDIILYYYILLVLNKNDKPMSFSEIEDELVNEGLINYDEISSKTIERKLNEMCSVMEIVSCQKKGRSKEYFIPNDILSEFNDEEIEKLSQVAELYKNIIFPHISGHYFCDTLKDYMKFERNLNIEEKDSFQYEYLHFHPVIDEELILKVMRAIYGRNKIIMKSGNNSRYNRYSRRSKKSHFKPVKLRYDVECGRFYVFGFYEDDKCVAVRLDRTDDIEILKSTFDYDLYLDKYKISMRNSFSSVPINNNNPCIKVRFELIINDDNERYLIDKIRGELGKCIFESISENRFTIEKEVNDCVEMVPWIRKYGENIKVLEPASLKKRLKKDWKDMLSNYGVIS